VWAGEIFVREVPVLLVRAALVLFVGAAQVLFVQGARVLPRSFCGSSLCFRNFDLPI